MIKLASPDIRESDIQKAVEVIQSGNLIQGRNVLAFEKALSAFAHIENCSVVSSGTAALHLALLALGIKPGDTVIVPAFTFPATANVVENIGANVLLCDVDKESYVVTPEAIETLIEINRDKNIKAIIVVHEFGYPVRIKEIAEISKRYRLKLIEDAACALGTIADGFHVGYYSDAACFSFHPRKAVTTGEGGAIISKDELLIDKIKVLRNHGIDMVNKQTDFLLAGLNYRMTDFQAALVLGQLERFREELKKRIELVSIYNNLLKSNQNITLPFNNQGHSWQSFMVVFKKQINRNLLIEKLKEVGIQTSLGAQALNCLYYYRQKYGVNEKSCPQANLLYNQGLVLPLYGKLKTVDIKYISDKLHEEMECML